MRLPLILPSLLLSFLVLSACRNTESSQSNLASHYTPAEIDSLSSLRWKEAQSYLDACQYRKAEKTLTEVIRIAPTPEAYSDRAFCHFQRKQYSEARNDLRTAMSDSLCSPETYHYCHHLLPKIQSRWESNQRRRTRIGQFLANILLFFTQLYLERVVEEQESRRTSNNIPTLYSGGNSNSTSTTFSSPISGSNERRPTRGGKFK